MKLLLFLTLFLSVQMLAHAVPIRTEQAAVEFALKNNPKLRAARQILKIAEARHLGSGRLSNPSIESTVAGGDRFEGRIELGLTQQFPLTNRLRLEKEISALELEAAKWEIAKAERELRIQVGKAFLNLASVHETISLRQQQ
ncbi:MAG: TolC family protein, partial [Chthoniobacterales bacterium]